ncbi:cell division protein ZapA [Reinekea thalattae]|uniref:Cell division protein ZapA n=1 Tax=Reinekea thalattae TaxID=2593301 RepID=A0A5C8ZA17_9GAMM|nr:cell division protein ZapA [Reinekea thalattae]TXR54802.1 cell division protein ZapA [Reinekea thalattae]
MSEKPKTLNVTILDRDYRVACPAGQESQLTSAANTLNNKMQEIRETGKVFGIERIAVMAALNLTHELLQARPDNDSERETINRLVEKIERALPKADDEYSNFELDENDLF